jgi:hypothetical protein
MQEDMKNTNHMRTALLFALSWSLVSSCSIIKGEELKRFDCTLQTISPNPDKLDLKGKAIVYYLYNKEKNEIIKIGSKYLGNKYQNEEIENKTYSAYQKEGSLVWGGIEEGISYNNYLKLKTLQLQSIIYDNNGEKDCYIYLQKG